MAASVNIAGRLLVDFTVELDDTPDLTDFRHEVRTWLAEQMRGTEHYRWTALRANRADKRDMVFRHELARRLGRKGWLYVTYPERFGGGGKSWRHQMVIESEIARYGLALRSIKFGGEELPLASIYRWGTQDQQDELMPPIVRGDVSGWLAMTEPQGGTDLANCHTTARRDGDDYVVNGQKVMIGHEGPVHFLWTLVCTDPAGSRHRNLSWLYIPAGLDGITITPMELMAGVKHAVFFDDVRIPTRFRIGPENEGWTVSRTGMELEHGGRGDLARRHGLVDRLVDYCQTHTRGGTPLIEDEGVRDVLAQMLIDLHALDLISMRNYWRRFTGNPHPYGGSQARYLMRMTGLANAQRLQQIAGYSALTRDLSVHEELDFENVVRTGITRLHGGGTQDTDRVIMARRLGLGRAEAETAPKTTVDEQEG